jgi:hypothetical protein
MYSTLDSCQILTKLEFFSTDFRKTFMYQISEKSFQWEPSYSMRTDGQTDKTKLIVAFRNFAKAPNNNWRIELQTSDGCGPAYWH